MGLHGTSIGPKIVNLSTGVAISDYNFTATVDSDWLSAGGADGVTFWVEATEDSGSGTLDIDVECSPDGGTTVFDMPGATNSQTKASFTQITATGNHMKHFLLPPSGADSNMRIRLELTAASSPDYTISIWYSLFYSGS